MKTEFAHMLTIKKHLLIPCKSVCRKLKQFLAQEERKGRGGLAG